MIDIRPVRYDSTDGGALVARAMADLAQRYGGGGDQTPVDPAQFVPPAGEFLVGYLDGVPVACGGWRGNGTDAEVKRMYTAPDARHRGIASAVLRALEDSARRYGRRRMILETGPAQPEAIALYEKLGYHRIEDFGHYRDAPGVRSYGLVL